jgi:transposase
MRDQGYTLVKIAAVIAVCKRTVQRWLSDNGLARTPLDRSHLRKLNAFESNQIVRFFGNHNTSTLADGVRFAEETFGKQASKTTIWRILFHSHLTFKRATTFYQEANQQRQQSFLSNLPDHLGSDWIALDEAAFFLNHSRKYAWSTRGHRAVVSRPGPRGQMHSLLLAISPTGVAKWQLYEGGVNSVRFQSFLSDLPDHTNLLLDNASSHRATHVLAKQGIPTVFETANFKNIQLKYLPPYSPTYNPVEYCFNAIRTSISANPPRMKRDLEGCLATAIKLLTPDICGKIFGHALRR